MHTTHAHTERTPQSSGSGCGVCPVPPPPPQVETVVGRGTLNGPLKLFNKRFITQRASNVLKGAVDEASRTTCAFVGTEHLLLAPREAPAGLGWDPLPWRGT